MRKLWLNFFGTEGLRVGLLADDSSPTAALLREQGTEGETDGGMALRALRACQIDCASLYSQAFSAIV